MQGNSQEGFSIIDVISNRFLVSSVLLLESAQNYYFIKHNSKIEKSISLFEFY